MSFIYFAEMAEIGEGVHTVMGERALHTCNIRCEEDQPESCHPDQNIRDGIWGYRDQQRSVDL